MTCHVATPSGAASDWAGVRAAPGLIVCHGSPAGPIDAQRSAGTFPELVDRVASEMGWVARSAVGLVDF